MPNPASAYCEEQGCTSEIRTTADGSQFGVCAPAVLATEAVGRSVYAGWIESVDSSYDFKFRYPPEWTAELDLRNDSMTYQHLLWLRAPEKPVAGVEMLIAFERIGENVGIERLGLTSELEQFADLIVASFEWER